MRIVETAFYVPECIRTNNYYEQKFALESGWIEQRTGIKSRHIADDHIFSSDLACRAVEQLTQLSQAQFLISVSSTPDSLLPSNANRIAHKLGLKNILCFDLMAGCSSFLYGLTVAQSFLSSGLFKSGLIVAAEKTDMIIKDDDKVTAPLFGDSSAAWLVAHFDADNIKAIYLGGDSSGCDDLYIPVSAKNNPTLFGNKVIMNGKTVFKNAVNRMSDSILIALERAKMTIADVDYIITHQANKRIIEQVQMKLEAPPEKILTSIEYLGNAISSSIPITYHLNKDKIVGKKSATCCFWCRL